MIAVLFYLGIINSHPTSKSNDSKLIPKDNGQVENIVINDKITSLNRMEITDTNQITKIGNKEFKIKKEVTVDGAFLLIDDAIREVLNMETVYADYAYVTNKYIIFTLIAQDWEKVVYVINENGEQVSVDDGDYQIHDLKIVDGKVEAKGHIFCGLDGDCPDKDLIIKYEDNQIIISPIK